MMAEFVSMLTENYRRPSVESIRQINRLTQDMKGFPEKLEVLVRETILSRPESYYGYIRVPYTLSDDAVCKILRYNMPDDQYFQQLTAFLQLDFTWYDDVGQHIMIWAESKEKITTAVSAIQMWLKIPPHVENGYY